MNTEPEAPTDNLRKGETGRVDGFTILEARRVLDANPVPMHGRSLNGQPPAKPKIRWVAGVWSVE